MSIITIVGAGMMGSALSVPANTNGHEVRIVGTPLDRDIIEHVRATGEHLYMKRKLPVKNQYFQIEQLDEALKGADLLICGVSSFGVDWFGDNVLCKLPKDLAVLSVTKGMLNLDDGTLIPYPVYYGNKYPDAPWVNAVGGPSNSYALVDLDATAVAFCGKDVNQLKFIKSLMRTDYYHISISTDIVGVECAVAMKNAYALAVSLAVGLSEKKNGVGVHQCNSQAALFGQSVKEMRELLKIVGGADENIVYGAGDLYVTVFGGRTRLLGTLLGRGLSFEDAMAELAGLTLESVVIIKRTAQAVYKLIERGIATKEQFPLMLHVDEIISRNKSVNIPYKAFEAETII